MTKIIQTFDDSLKYLENKLEAKKYHFNKLDVLDEFSLRQELKQDAQDLEICLDNIEIEVNGLDGTLQEVIQEKAEAQAEINFICDILFNIQSDEAINDIIKGRLQNVIDEHYKK